jgi:DNA primase
MPRLRCQDRNVLNRTQKQNPNRKHRRTQRCHRALALGRKSIIIVESYTAVWWLHQAGFPNVVAVMGAAMSDAQATLILTRFAPSFAVVLTDGDAAGSRMAESALTRLAPALWIRWEKLGGVKTEVQHLQK